MAEVPAAREHHRRAGRVDRFDHLRVAHRAAGLDDRGDPGLDRQLADRRRTGRTRPRPSPRHRAALCAFSSASRTASTRLIWPAPMPTVARSARDHDRVGAHVLADLPGEQQLLPLRLGRPALGRRPASRSRSSRSDVTVLHEHAAGDLPQRRLAAACELRRSRSSRMRMFGLRREHLERILVVAAREQNLDELSARAPPRARDPHGRSGR